MIEVHTMEPQTAQPMLLQHNHGLPIRRAATQRPSGRR